MDNVEGYFVSPQSKRCEESLTATMYKSDLISLKSYLNTQNLTVLKSRKILMVLPKCLFTGYNLEEI